MIPVCDLKLQYVQIEEEIDEAIKEVAASGHYILGPQVKTFEEQVAAYCDCEFAVGVGSGTDALHLSLRALGIGPGDEVITTPFTFIATTEAIGLVGATPVFVDIDPHTFNIDVNKIESAITEKTKAIMPVHLYGQPCEMNKIRAIAEVNNLYVIEDAAQAFGASYLNQKIGTLGNVGCFSFFPSKNLGCFGDGGMVVTNDRGIYERIEMLRRHGGKVKYHHSELGLNSRLDTLQAAILSVKLKYIDTWNTRRRSHAYQYNKLLAHESRVQTPQELNSNGFASPTILAEQSDITSSVYHQYTVLVEERDCVQEKLTANGIGTAVYYPVPLHLQEVHGDLHLQEGAFPVAENISKRCLSLPMFPELTNTTQKKVIAELLNGVAKHSGNSFDTLITRTHSANNKSCQRQGHHLANY